MSRTLASPISSVLPLAKQERTFENDIRLIANYAMRLEKVLDRIEQDELEAATDYDLWILKSHFERVGYPASNLAMDCASILDYRQGDPTRGREPSHIVAEDDPEPSLRRAAIVNAKKPHPGRVCQPDGAMGAH